MSNSVLEKARNLRESSDFEAFAALCKENSIPEIDQDQFWNSMTDDLPVGSGYSSASQKIDAELKAFNGGQKEKVVSSHVAKALKQFCKNEAFALAVFDNKKTLSDCCKEVMNGVGNSVSDIEVYRRAVSFYFPGAKVAFKMEIDINGTAIAAEETTAAGDMPVKPAAKKLAISRAKAKREKDTGILQVSMFNM